MEGHLGGSVWSLPLALVVILGVLELSSELGSLLSRELLLPLPLPYSPRSCSVSQINKILKNKTEQVQTHNVMARV